MSTIFLAFTFGAIAGFISGIFMDAWDRTTPPRYPIDNLDESYRRLRDGIATAIDEHELREASRFQRADSDDGC